MLRALSDVAVAQSARNLAHLDGDTREALLATLREMHEEQIAAFLRDLAVVTGFRGPDDALH
jgi:hypothetical protein